MSRQSVANQPLVFVMAAGLGTRMKSETPKVLHKIAGRPMLHWVVTAARAAGASRIVAILGHKHEVVKAALDASFGAGEVHVALQPEQRGTGHAVQCALPAVEDEPDDRIVVILTGDAPLPTDGYVEPSRKELFLDGKLEGREPHPPTAEGGFQVKPENK